MKKNGTADLVRGRFHASSARLTILRRWLLAGAAGFLLSGVEVAGQMTPIAACLATALPFGFCGLFAAAGAAAGYLLVGEGGAAAEQITMTVLMLASVAVFQGTALPGRDWFFPVISAAVAAVLGAVFFFSAPGSEAFAALLLKISLGACATAGFRNAMDDGKAGRLFLLASLVAGLGGMKIPVDLGLLAACMLCVRMPETGMAAACGIALELSGRYGGSAAACLVLPVLLYGVLRLRRPVLRAPVCFAVTCGVLLLCREGSAARVLGVGIGCLAGAAFGRVPLPRIGFNARIADGDCLTDAARILESLREKMNPERTEKPAQSETDSVYDGAAERVCRCCARFHSCWEHSAERTYHALTAASRRIMDRGVAQAEDFSADFRDNCCHFEGFLTALNQELDGMLYHRRYRMQLQEARQIVAEEFSCVSELLLQMRQTPSPRKGAYRPVTGISTARKCGSHGNGDRGACFYGPHTEYYILLCDGMGSGPEAAAVSSETVHFLKQLLFAGMSAEAALRMLNGVFLLRGDGCFATVDLLRIDLRSGEALLLKWGAAPSYLKENELSVKKIGTASLPPGVGVGGDHAPEQFRLSLRDGEMLILLSDGAQGEETDRMIAEYAGDSPRELAAMLIAGTEAVDDMTAVAVSIRPRFS